MSVRNPRTRLISFRLSEREYRALQTLCEAKEARSLSDFVRGTVRWIVDNGDPSNPGFHTIPPAKGLPWALAEDDGLPKESGGNGWGAALADELLKLSHKSDVLDREIRRLKLLLTKP